MTRPLKGIIADALESKGLSLEKLASLAEIPLAQLTAIMEQTPEKLPAFPYIRASLLRLAAVLGLDSAALIEIYKEQYADKHSGPSDQLPRNRFAIARPSRRWWYVGAAILAVVLYAVLHSGVFGQPYLQLENPPIGEEPYLAQDPSIELRGVVEPADKVFINGEAVVVDEDGRFRKVYPLKSESNPFEFRVVRFLGKELVVIRNVLYAPPIEAETSATSTESGTILEEDVIE